MVMWTDVDQPIIMEIKTGFTVRDELAVCIDLQDYDDPRYNCSTMAVVNEDDARVMARRHKVDYWDLPLFIAECMSEWREIVNSDFKQAVDCFKEITECLLDEGCRFKIVRTYGPRRSQCC